MKDDTERIQLSIIGGDCSDGGPAEYDGGGDDKKTDHREQPDTARGAADTSRNLVEKKDGEDDDEFAEVDDIGLEEGEKVDNEGDGNEEGDGQSTGIKRKATA